MCESCCLLCFESKRSHYKDSSARTQPKAALFLALHYEYPMQRHLEFDKS